MSRTITYICSQCDKEETWWEAKTYDWMSGEQEHFPPFEECKYCEDMFCEECLISHIKEER